MAPVLSILLLVISLNYLRIAFVPVLHCVTVGCILWTSAQHKTGLSALHLASAWHSDHSLYVLLLPLFVRILMHSDETRPLLPDTTGGAKTLLRASPLLQMRALSWCCRGWGGKRKVRLDWRASDHEGEHQRGGWGFEFGWHPGQLCRTHHWKRSKYLSVPVLPPIGCPPHVVDRFPFYVWKPFFHPSDLDGRARKLYSSRLPR